MKDLQAGTPKFFGDTKDEQARKKKNTQFKGKKSKKENKLDQNEFHQIKKKKLKPRTPSLKKQMRDIQRGITHFKKTNPDAENTREVPEQLQQKIKDLNKEKKEVRRKAFVDKKYEQIKQFETKKLVKQLKQAKNAKAEATTIQEIQNKMNYIKFYPSGNAYISIQKDSGLTDKARLERDELLKAATEKRHLQIQNKLNLPFDSGKNKKTMDMEQKRMERDGPRIIEEVDPKMRKCVVDKKGNVLPDNPNLLEISNESDDDESVGGMDQEDIGECDGDDFFL